MERGCIWCLASPQVSSRELVCHSCLKKTLHKLEGMMRILQAETAEGTGTPTGIADSILNITGAGAAMQARATPLPASPRPFPPLPPASPALPRPFPPPLPPPASPVLPPPPASPALSRPSPQHSLPPLLPQVTLSTWPVRTCRARSPQSWAQSRRR